MLSQPRKSKKRLATTMQYPQPLVTEKARKAKNCCSVEFNNFDLTFRLKTKDAAFLAKNINER